MGLADLNVRGRLLANLRVLAARFGAPFGDGTAIDLSLTESDLAELIGASRPKVSTSLSALIEDGLIRRVRRRLILAQKGENSSISGHSKGTIDALEDTNQ
jgi:CRP-like cAMP-binding protein